MCWVTAIAKFILRLDLSNKATMTMKSTDLCSMPCLENPRIFSVPNPGETKAAFAFHRDRERQLYFIMPRNHPAKPAPTFNPRVMIVGLSPAGNQIEGFLDKYRSSESYDQAARWASFRGMEDDIIRMFKGLEIDKYLGLLLDETTTFAGHPDILTNSLVKCASLTVDGSSDDFDPQAYLSNVRCITRRFFTEVTNFQFTRLSHVFVFGDKATVALKSILMDDGLSVWKALEAHGLQLISLPHPSGQNGEYVKLAKLSSAQFPAEDHYAERKWQEYSAKPPRKGRAKQAELQYKNKRKTYWREIANLRKLFASSAQ